MTGSNTSKALYEKMSKEEIYLSNEFEQAVVKSLPGEKGFYVKFKGEREFKALKGSGVVAEALVTGQERTKEQYENW